MPTFSYDVEGAYPSISCYMEAKQTSNVKLQILIANRQLFSAPVKLALRKPRSENNLIVRGFSGFLVAARDYSVV